MPDTTLPDSTAGPALSIGQQALWLIHREAPASAAYNVSLPLRFRQRLEPGLLQRSLDHLLALHPGLGSRFVDERGQVRCLTGGVTRMPLKCLEARLAPGGRSLDDAPIGYLTVHADAPFDLSRGAARAVLLDGSDGCVVLLTFHHIVIDGYSQSVIGRDLIETYARLARGEAPRAPTGNADCDYAAWESDLLAGPRGARMERYWKRRLAGPAPTLQLPTDRPRSPVRTSNGAAVAFAIDADLARRLTDLARVYNTRLVNVLLCAYQVLLRRYTAQESIWIGIPTAVPRTEPRFADLVGYLVNLMVVTARFPADGGLRFVDLLQSTTEEMLSGLFHQPYPFPTLARQLRPHRDRSLTPLIQTTFSFTAETLMPNELAAADCRAEVIDLPQMAGQHDLSIAFIREQPLRGLFLYNTDLFDQETIERMSDRFRMLLEAIVAAPEAPIDALPLLTDADRARLRALNDTGPAPSAQAELPSDLPPDLVTRFEAQVRRTPDAPALIRQESALTYAELDARADRIAHGLSERGVAPGALVGVCLHRNLDLVPCLLGIMKAGAAYVPFDPGYPRERLAGMLEDSRIAVLMTQRAILSEHPWLLDRDAGGRSGAGDLLTLDEDSALGQTRPAGLPRRPRPADALAYVLFTSGSTGRPKGVMIRHQGVAWLLSWALKTFALETLRGVLASTSINFDLSVFEIFVPLVAGGTVILAEHALELPSLPQRHRVTLINTVPSAMTELLRNGSIPDSVRTVNLAGEPLKKALVQGLYALPQIEAVYNLYGPSEDTTYSTWERVARAAAGEPTIGRPVDGTRAYILDARLNPLPPGLPGELCLAGQGLAAGYLGRPELTAERFLETDPLGVPERIYRTGDLARWLPDGRLQYLGRIDHQVKLRGYRIELGEIEAALTRHPDIDDAVVVLDDGGGNPRLVAYVGSARGDALKDELAVHLRARLPGYMIPSLIQVLPALPLNPNGKIDRARLPAPELARAPYAPPRDSAEQRVAEVWREVLDLALIGIDEGFFDLGGHSLLLLRVHHLLSGDYPGLAMVDLFGYPTVRLLAAHLRGLAGGAAAAPGGGEDPASAAAARAARRRTHLAAMQRRKGLA